MKKLLVIRFSALGDVAMTIPVLYSVATSYPDLQITILTRSVFRPLFEKLPDNVSFLSVDLQGEYKGVTGLYRLSIKLKKMGFDGVADLHDVLRTKFIRWCFRLAGTTTAHIRKGRKEKKALTRPKNKILRPLKASFVRYAEVFEKLNLPVQLNFTSIYGKERGLFEPLLSITGEKDNSKWIGIAPFAKHKGKIYPLPLMEKVVQQLSLLPDSRIFLFGGGKEEVAILSGWEEKYPGVLSLPGKLNMADELTLMSWLDVMISMDSANMHMASLTNTPVISIWGATHPWAGFMGWNQSFENTIQTDLPCRPCSVYGNIPCLRKDYACLQLISPETIVNRTKSLLSNGH